MYFVYILQSLKNGRYYIGSTENIERRMLEHNSGKTKSLKYRLPMKLVFKKDFVNRIDAVKIERKLKSWKNRKILEKIIKDKEIRGL